MNVLIVEDDKKVSNFLKTSLESQYFNVTCRANGKDGLNAAIDNDYDIIVLDYILPEKNGYEVCKAIRADGVKTPILMLSVKTTLNTKVELLNAGADDYLTKPFSLDELTARINALLRRPPQAEQIVLAIDTLTLDPQKILVERNGSSIPLTRKEFMLLEHLMRHTHTVVSRKSLLEHIWGMHADPFSNTVESHISTLRKKIHSEKDKKLIHTVPGGGYILSDKRAE